MFKSLRRTLNDRIGYALAGIDWKHRPEPKPDDGIEALSNPLDGLLKPIFARYEGIERRAANPLRELIDETLYGAGCLTPTNSSLVNLNLAIYSILLLMQAGANVGPGPFPDQLLRAIERDWDLALKRSEVVSPKGNLVEQIGNQTERQAFLIHHGSASNATQPQDLYYHRAKVLGFLISLRSEGFHSLGSPGPSTDGHFIWSWAFGRTMERQLAQMTPGLIGRLVEATRLDTLSLYRIDATSNPRAEIILRCPSCAANLKLALPLKAKAGRCGGCKTLFTVVIEGDNVQLKPAVQPEQANVRDPAVESALAVLGLSGEFESSDIKAAYRKRMSEYHPDKVSALGQKLRDLAESECKEINAAMDVLRAAGLLTE